MCVFMYACYLYVCVCDCVCMYMHARVCVCDICVCMGVYAGLLFQMYVYIICLRVSTYMNACVHVYIHLDGRVDAWKMCVCAFCSEVAKKNTYATRPAQIVTCRGRNHMLPTDSSVLISLSLYYGMKRRMLGAWLWQHLLGNCCGLGWLGSFLISSVDKAYWEDRGSQKLHLQEARVGH